MEYLEFRKAFIRIILDTVKAHDQNIALGKYEVNIQNMLSKSKPHIHISYNGDDKYNIAVPCDDDEFNKIVFSKNSELFFIRAIGLRVKDSREAYALHKEDAIKNEEFQKFITGFMHDVFPEREQKIKKLLEVFNNKK